jgi:hypothetical protein
MLIVVLHALASSECTETTFQVVLVLAIWDDKPWNSVSVRGHMRMSNVIHIPASPMRFVPAHKHSDEATTDLSPAKWPVEFVLVANEKCREAYIPQPRLDSAGTCPCHPRHLPPCTSADDIFKDVTFFGDRASASDGQQPKTTKCQVPGDRRPNDTVRSSHPTRGGFHEAYFKILLALGHIP